MVSFSKLPTRRLQEVKGKTLMRWHIKIIHINVNKSFGSSSQNKFSKSSHSIWTQCAQLFVTTLDLHPHVEEHLLKLLRQRSKLSPRDSTQHFLTLTYKISLLLLVRIPLTIDLQVDEQVTWYWPQSQVSSFNLFILIASANLTSVQVFLRIGVVTLCSLRKLKIAGVAACVPL